MKMYTYIFIFFFIIIYENVYVYVARSGWWAGTVEFKGQEGATWSATAYHVETDYVRRNTIAANCGWRVEGRRRRTRLVRTFFTLPHHIDEMEDWMCHVEEGARAIIRRGTQCT